MYTKNYGHEPTCNQEKVMSRDVAAPGEVTRVMNNLMGIVTTLRDAVNELGTRLNPVLPHRTEVCADGPIPKQSEEYLCPLARAIESEYRRLSELNENIHQIMNDIEI